MRIEIRTDRLAIGPWEQVGAERAGRLAALMQPLAAAVMDAGEIPVPNPIALPWPPPPAA